MDTINPNMLKAFRNDFADAVKGLESKYNIKLDIHSISYEATGFHTKLTGELLMQNPQGEQVSLKARRDYLTLCSLFGLSPDAFGKTFVGRSGVTLKVAGINPRAPKNPVILEGSDGKTYRCSEDFVKLKLKGLQA